MRIALHLLQALIKSFKAKNCILRKQTISGILISDLFRSYNGHLPLVAKLMDSQTDSISTRGNESIHDDLQQQES